MFTLQPSYIFTPKGFIKDKTVVFNERIIDIIDSNLVTKQYPNATPIDTPTHCVLMPGFINTHVHLEFSANKTTLKYGQFLPWLYSVINKRESLMNACDTVCIDTALQSMLYAGTTTIGAISSNGLDLTSCSTTPMRVVYFNELIGSNAQMADALFADFKARLDSSLEKQSAYFKSGIAIHSPYSVHPILVKKALEIAQKNSLPVSAHLLESSAEKEWLKQGTGEFLNFFTTLLNQKSPVTTIEEFIAQFNGINTLFTHATQLDTHYLPLLDSSAHTIVHCPVSNRLLGNGVLNTQTLFEHQIDFVTATDGLSSNSSLNLLDELKAALFMHHDANAPTLALSLLHSITTTAGKKVPFDVGSLEKGMLADMVLFDVGAPFEFDEDIALHMILQQFAIHARFIGGKKH